VDQAYRISSKATGLASSPRVPVLRVPAKMLSSRKTTSVSDDLGTPPPSAIKVNTSGSVTHKKLNETDSVEYPTQQRPSAGIELFRSGVEAALFSRKIPSKGALTQQLQVSAKALDKARKETYQKKFRLWSKSTVLILLLIPALFLSKYQIWFFVLCLCPFLERVLAAH